MTLRNEKSDAACDRSGGALSVELVPASGSDVDAVLAGARHIGSLNVPDCGLDPPEVLQILSTVYHGLEIDPGWGGWFITSGGQIVGFCSLTGPLMGDDCEIGYSVFEAFRGRKVATSAVTQIVAEARSRGIKGVRAETTRDNLASQAVLTTCGFVASGERFDPEDGDILIWQLSR